MKFCIAPFGFSTICQTNLNNQVHKRLLCDRVPGFFDNAFKGTFIDSKEQIMRLPNDDVEAFTIFTDFVYRNVVPRTPRKPSSVEEILDWTKNMIAAYVLGSYIGLNHFMNRVCF